MKKKFTVLCSFLFASLMVAACAPKAPEAKAIESITIAAKETTVYVGKTIEFTADIKPADATDKTLTWSSSTTAATIDAKGVLTGNESGVTMITAKSKDGTIKSNSVSITVKTYRPVTSVAFKNENITIQGDGGFAYPDVTVLPGNATEPELAYESSNESVVKVENGMIKGVNPGTATITVKAVSDETKKDTLTVNVTAGTWNNYKSYDATAKYDFKDLQMASKYNLNAIPGTGKVKALVIPFEFTDYPFSESILTDLNNLFNGNGEESTGYWESLKTYYEKSSYGQLELSFEIADIYKSGLKAATTTGGGTKSIDLGTAAYNNYKKVKSTKCTEFDSDKDGYADAVYFVYSAPDYSKVSSLDNDLFWAFCYWKQNYATPSLTDPDFNAFMWASYDFMYAQGKSKVDAHTFIHESGHLLGSNDYYNYNRSSSQKPLGDIDMMDHNIGDHNSYTKMAYGWTDPIYVEGNAKIKIKTAQLYKDNFILINQNWNKTAFDEYLLLELSTPLGVNKLDSEKNYSSGYPRVYWEPGIKMYHVDARLAKFESSKLVYGCPDTIPNKSGWEIPAANSDFKDRNDTPELFYECGLIQAGKKATMLKEGASGNNSDLFHTGNYFRMEDYNQFFYKDIAAFNAKDGSGNRYTCDYEIYFESVTAEEATLVIQHSAQVNA